MLLVVHRVRAWPLEYENGCTGGAILGVSEKVSFVSILSHTPEDVTKGKNYYRLKIKCY